MEGIHWAFQGTQLGDILSQQDSVLFLTKAGVDFTPLQMKESEIMIREFWGYSTIFREHDIALPV